MGSVALFSYSQAGAQVTAPNSQVSHADNVIALDALSVGQLPTEISDVVSNITTYRDVEQGLNDGFVTDVTDAQTALDVLNQDATDKQVEINDLIAEDPLDPQIAVKQGELDIINVNVGTATTALADANAIVQDSVIKLALYDGAIAGPVADAQAAAANAATAISDALTAYSTPNSTGGLQSVIDAVDGVTAGDQAPTIAAIEAADAAFALTGADNATVADIQALVGAIDTELPNLAPISDADKTTALETVLNGAYEREAIANLSDTVFAATLEAGEVGLDGVVTKKADGTIHIGENSLITAEVAGVQELYAQDGAAAAIDINVTNGSDLLIDNVSVATDADVTANSAADQGYADAQDVLNSAADQAYTDAREVAITLAYEGYADQAEADANAYTDAREAAITSAYQAADANLQSQISENKKDIEQNTRGIAMVAALQHTTVLPGMNNAFDLSAAHFEGETGMALNYARRINENVQINFGAASTTDFDESVIKAGIGVQW